VQTLVKKTLKTSSKSANKQQHNACSNDAPLKRTVLRTQERDQKTKKKHHIFTPTAGTHCSSPQTLHGGRSHRAHHKRCNHFSI